MKKISVLILLSVLSNLVFAQTRNNSDSSGMIYFMRSTGSKGSATAFTVFIDDSLVCHLNNKNYSVHNITPGLHHFSSQFGGKASKENAEKIDIEVQPGKSYYIELILERKLFVNNLYCNEITENSANKIFPKLKLDSTCE